MGHFDHLIKAADEYDGHPFREGCCDLPPRLHDAAVSFRRLDGRPVVARLSRTCCACPSQWEGIVNDGRVVYIRYRSGLFTIGLGATITDAVYETVFRNRVGDSLDGFMTDERMRELAGDVLAFPDGLVVVDEDPL